MADPGNEVVYLDHGGVQRRYVLHRPAGLPDLAPAVVMLDGRGGTPWTAMKITGWSRLADREGFAVAYPEATRLHPGEPMHYLTNPQMWCAGHGGSDTERPPVDDAGFLRAVIDDLPDRAGTDPRRIGLTGFSNGASMVFRYAAEHPGTVAAIAPIAGHFRRPPRDRIPPLPCLMMFGKLDPLSPFDGGEVHLPWGAVERRPAAMDSFRGWLTAIDIDPDTVRHQPGDGLDTWEAGPASAPARLIAIHDLAHVWPGGHRLLPESIVGPGSNRIDATQTVWSFFARACS